jgi:hypothetical protein
MAGIFELSNFRILKIKSNDSDEFVNKIVKLTEF